MPNYHGLNVPTIDSEYALKRNEAIRRDNPNTGQFVARTMQQHHDYFKKLHDDAVSAGMVLNENDQIEYNLAMDREKLGLVYPGK
jgi:hypothetical protein